MNEFVSRMATQRHVLNVINRKASSAEKLFGLSSSAIERWAVVNRIEPTSEIVRLLRQVSSELFFMATRSQEPVSAEYEIRLQRIVDSVLALENAVEQVAPYDH